MVCHHSIDAQNLWGASNVNPAYVGLPQNFEDIVNHVFAAHGISTPLTNYFCNPYSIDFPKSYNKTPAVIINYTNKVDSCNCGRFAALKQEAHALAYDTLSFSSMNQFFKDNYYDSLTSILWTGLQHCDSSFVDSCIQIWGPADDLPLRPGKFAKNNIQPDDDCTTPTIESVSYITSVTQIILKSITRLMQVQTASSMFSTNLAHMFIFQVLPVAMNRNY